MKKKVLKLAEKLVVSCGGCSPLKCQASGCECVCHEKPNFYCREEDIREERLSVLKLLEETRSFLPHTGRSAWERKVITDLESAILQLQEATMK